MAAMKYKDIFNEQVLKELLPPQLSDNFFEALYGAAEEGAYDISLAFREHDPGQNTLVFELQLHERPGKCLACNLTYGLPEVFSRHPLINLKGIVEKIEGILGGETKCVSWELGTTDTPASSMHAIPLTIRLG